MRRQAPRWGEFYTISADLHAFNRQLAAWLIWYNAQKPHRALAGNTPLNFLHSQLKNGQLLWTPTGNGRGGGRRSALGADGRRGNRRRAADTAEQGGANNGMNAAGQADAGGSEPDNRDPCEKRP